MTEPTPSPVPPGDALSDPRMALGWREAVRPLASLWLGAVLLVLLLFVMGCATVYEKMHGTSAALAVFYYSWWFFGLWLLTAVNVVAAVVVRFPWNWGDLGFLLTHGGLIVILAGTSITMIYAERGNVAITEGEVATEFLHERTDQLSITNQRTGELVGLNLQSVPVESDGSVKPGHRVNLGGFEVEVAAFYADSEARRVVTNDSPVPVRAARVKLETPLGVEDQWLLRAQPVAMCGQRYEFRLIGTAGEMQRILSGAGATGSESKGNVEISLPGAMHSFPLEQVLEKEIALPGTEFKVRVLRYLPHATVGQEGKVVNLSDRPQNPYIEAEITGPKGTTLVKSFAKYPDYGTMHGKEKIEGLKVRFESTAVDVVTTGVDVLRAPSGEIFAHFRRDGKPVTLPLAPGGSIDLPEEGHRLRYVEQYGHARVSKGLFRIDPPRAEPWEGVRVTIRGPKGTGNSVLQKGQGLSYKVAGAQYMVAYRRRSIPFGFSVRLDRFNVGRYPGSMRPRTFESHITVTDAATRAETRTVISMNNPFSMGKYTLYQQSYREGRGKSVTILSVAWDPGLVVVFVGYSIVMAGMLLVLITRMRKAKALAAMQQALTSDPPEVQGVQV